MFAYIQEFPVFFSEKAVLHPYIVNEVFAFKIVNKNLAHNTEIQFFLYDKLVYKWETNIFNDKIVNGIDGSDLYKRGEIMYVLIVTVKNRTQIEIGFWTFFSENQPIGI